MIQSQVTEIGAKAVNKDELLLILFNETATEALRTYSIIQKFSDKQEFSLKAGDTIAFDDQEYTINHVGRTANQNLNTVGHVTLVFDQAPDADGIVNGIYLSPNHLPEIHEGTVIQYQ